MSYTRLGDLTADMARLDNAAAFIVASLARAKGVSDPDSLRDVYLPSRNIPRQLHASILKAATPALDTSSGLAPATPQAAAFLGSVVRQAAFGQIGALTVSGNVTATVQVGQATASWEGEQKPKRIRALSFVNAGLTPRKLTAVVVMSEELATLSTPDALSVVQRALTSAAASALDDALLDPTSAAIAGVKPGSLTNGLTPVAASGDLTNNVAQVLGAVSGGAPTRPVLIGSLLTLLRIQNAELLDRLGVRLIVSPSAGNRLVAVDADGVLLNSGGVELTTGQPDLQMDDQPTDPSTSSTVLISTWSRNLIAAKVELWATWTARPGAVAVLTVA